MNIKALITSLVLGSSSVALAQPVSFGASASVSANVGLGYGYQSGPVVRDHRTPVRPAPQLVTWHDRYHAEWTPAPVMVHPIYQPRWIELASQMRNMNYTEQVTVGRDKGYFHTIEVLPTVGQTYVTELKIGFTDGTYMAVDPHRTIEPGCEPIKLDIPVSSGRTIARILVTGKSGFDATYRVVGA